MTEPARHDPPAPRYVPDPDLVSRAQRHMLDVESEAERYLRQHVEDAFGATRVAMCCLRDVVPFDLDLLDDSDAEFLAVSLRHVESAYMHLDALSPVLLGRAMDDVLTGRITTHGELDDLGVPQ